VPGARNVAEGSVTRSEALVFARAKRRNFANFLHPADRAIIVEIAARFDEGGVTHKQLFEEVNRTISRPISYATYINCRKGTYPKPDGRKAYVDTRYVAPKVARDWAPLLAPRFADPGVSIQALTREYISLLGKKVTDFTFIRHAGAALRRAKLARARALGFDVTEEEFFDHVETSREYQSRNKTALAAARRAAGLLSKDRKAVAKVAQRTRDRGANGGYDHKLRDEVAVALDAVDEHEAAHGVPEWSDRPRDARPTDPSPEQIRARILAIRAAVGNAPRTDYSDPVAHRQRAVLSRREMSRGASVCSLDPIAC
jgi:hypothetical protein